MGTAPQQPDWRRYLLWAAIWVAFIAALGYAASRGSLGFLENDMHFALEPNRERVKLSSREPAIIQVKARLSNNTRAAVTLKAPSACKIFRWQIFDRAGSLVQSKVSEDICPLSEVSAILPTGQTLEEFYAIVLVAPRYRAGEDYLVHAWYWGYEAEFQFKAE